MAHNELRHYVQQLSLPGQIAPNPLTGGQSIETGTVVFSHLDYLAIMYPYPERTPKQGLGRLPLPADLFQMDRLERGVKNWRQSMTLLPSGRFYWNEDQRNAGSYAVFAGDDLALIRTRLRMSDDELLKRLAFNATNFTRLDFCVNITAGSAGETRAEYEKGYAETRVKTAWEPDYFAGGQGRTIYFGSRQSTKMLRVYDKARELRLADDVILNRIELQARKDAANILSGVMVTHTVIDAGKTAIRDFCDFPRLGWYQDALSGGKDVAMQLTPAKESDFMKWLYEQVGPSMCKRIDAGEYHAELRDWLHSMYEYIRVGEQPAQPDKPREDQANNDMP